MTDTNGKVSSAAPLFRAIRGVATTLAALHVALFLWWGAGPVLAQAPWLVPLMHGFLMLAAFSVAFLALGRCWILRDPASYWIGIAFVVTGVTTIFYVLTWPGLMPSGQPIMGHLVGTPAWIALLMLSLLV